MVDEILRERSERVARDSEVILKPRITFSAGREVTVAVLAHLHELAEHGRL